MDEGLNAADLHEHVLEYIFSYLSLHDLKNCSIVCQRWNSIINHNENNDIWR